MNKNVCTSDYCFHFLSVYLFVWLSICQGTHMFHLVWSSESLSLISKFLIDIWLHTLPYPAYGYLVFWTSRWPIDVNLLHSDQKPDIPSDSYAPSFRIWGLNKDAWSRVCSLQSSNTSITKKWLDVCSIDAKSLFQLSFASWLEQSFAFLPFVLGYKSI